MSSTILGKTVICTCKEKHRDKNGVIRAYTLIDKNGVGQLIEANILKTYIQQGQIKVVNLKMTSDGRLIDDNIKESLESMGNRIEHNKKSNEQNQKEVLPRVSKKEFDEYNRRVARRDRVNNFLGVFSKIGAFFEDMWDTDGDFTIND